MRLYVGLRNPGRRYQGTRHNVGAEVVEALARRLGVDFKRAPGRIAAVLAEARLDEERLLLGLPRTFMNESGGPVAALLRYFDLPPEDLVTVHDDIDLALGRLRFHSGRGTGGHRGVDSVARATGTLDFWRLRVGVGRPRGSMDPADYVLRPFDRSERPEVDLLVQDAADVLVALARDGSEAAVRAAGERRPGPA